MSDKHPFTKIAIGVSLLISLTICVAAGAFRGHNALAPAPEVETVALFNPATPDAPESIVIDHQGNKFISLSLTGEIRKIAPNGAQSTHAMLPNGVFSFEPPNPPTGGMTGMALDNDGTIYVNLVASDPANRGVWAVAPDGSIRMLAQLPANAVPNGIARRHDVLYIADSVLGVVWKVPTSGGAATIWADHPLLKLGPIPGIPGPNGLQIFHNEVYVANPGHGVSTDNHGLR
jgi:sugar lactone lactonase YvrE